VVGRGRMKEDKIGVMKEGRKEDKIGVVRKIAK
jgi:hypothetical protein